MTLRIGEPLHATLDPRHLCMRVFVLLSRLRHQESVQIRLTCAGATNPIDQTRHMYDMYCMFGIKQTDQIRRIVVFRLSLTGRIPKCLLLNFPLRFNRYHCNLTNTTYIPVMSPFFVSFLTFRNCISLFLKLIPPFSIASNFFTLSFFNTYKLPSQYYGKDLECKRSLQHVYLKINPHAQSIPNA